MQRRRIDSYNGCIRSFAFKMACVRAGTPMQVMDRGKVVLGLMLLIAGIGHAQSLADAARANRQQETQEGSTATKVITDDDFAAPPNITIHLVPGATSTGDGTLVAPGRWKHNYFITNVDATRFPNGGVLHIEITLGDGPAEASFDLYSLGARLPSGGLPNPLASAHNVPSGATARISYHFDHATTFQLGAEGAGLRKLATEIPIALQ